MPYIRATVQYTNKYALSLHCPSTHEPGSHDRGSFSLYMPTLYTRTCHSTPGKKPSAASASGDCDQTAAPLVKVETADLPTWDEISA